MGMVDDSELFSFWKKLAMNKILCVPKEVALLKTSEQSILATAAFLVGDKNLSLISVWSPSFLGSILESIFKYKTEIISILNTGSWQSTIITSNTLKAPKNKRAAKILSSLSNENQASIWQQLWPKLSLISCWDTALAKSSCEQLSALFPEVPFQGKGLWSTEAVVTIPFKNNYALAYQSHFYEFKVVESDSIIPSWELKPGMKVMPVLTTGSGLLRYLIKDVLIVNNFWNKTPCLTFMGRTGYIDMVGEKLEQNSISKHIEKYNAKSNNYKIVSLLACKFPDLKPYYCLLVDALSPQPNLSKFEEELIENFHYRLAKDVGQLGEFKVVTSVKAKDLYLDLKESEGMIRGNIKIEAITLLQDPKTHILLKEL